MSTSYRKLFLTILLFLNAAGYAHCQNKQEKLIVFHLDFNSVSLKKEYVIKWLQKASQMGYNAVLWEIEDDVKWETCPECTSPDAFTKEEFKEIIAYSRTLGLEPIPLLQTIGHAEYVLQHEKYFSFREDPTRYDCYCTSNESVKDFLKKWIKEYIELFGELRYFHLGGDEAYAFATCEICKSTAEKIGENKLYADYLNDIAQPLLSKNIRPGIWCDMMLSHPEQIEVISKEFVIWDWNYWDGDATPQRVMVWGKGRISKEKISEEIKLVFPEIINQDGELNSFYTSDVLSRYGYDVILSSTSRSHGDAVFAGRNDLYVDNIIGAARKTAEDNLLGTCVTSWAVRIPNHETQEPWLYLAPLTINNPNLTKDEILLQTSKELFGYESLEVFEVFNRIGYPFPFAGEKSTGIMWTGLKDSKPAPPNYINELIDGWVEKEKWDDVNSQVLQSTEIITSGIQKFNDITTKFTKGFEIQYNWSKAAHFQFWQSIIAKEIVNKVNGGNTKTKKEMIELIGLLKHDYINWGNDWMTEKSAKQNAGLIYDAIENYFKHN
ncbi:MAG: family 20 glycosylhydrolase [Ignavibacteria bacterium]|jgi:hypothetical protein